ncbi:NAD+ diphosphatase [Rhodoblastus acidophilus]|uniref:NAD(+) diphosphatase n=1 Tax=Rhodoblastus acidophilus TaxID=1074 RepID=UPI002224083B|nr:NAD(+) diphosphatase [Rhodoblastus acidophilus]MCW2284141.1 NAD+ diphosphatase [Rhodoblastus acidophilus]MCW2332986.1 NAD+ diphosphatase [Rhodoblastus acidophilus]
MNPFDLIGFSGNPLDRLSEKRDDAAALAALLANPGARAVAFAGTMPVVRANGGGCSALHALDDLRALPAEEAPVLLGRDDEGPVYGLLLPEATLAHKPIGQDAFVDRHESVIAGRPDLSVRDLRALAVENALPRDEIAIIAQAKTVLHWHANHRFCARCGRETVPAQAGWRRDCENCGAQHFPRTDPVVIVLVTHGDSCLMGRQKQFPAGMYSCLAGFVECGETIEEAARREIFEESGVRLGAVKILASQPWPFPASLMIGCRAEALSRDIVMDAQELEDCRWFSREELRAMVADLHLHGLKAPHPIAIARGLLEHWLAGA